MKPVMLVCLRRMAVLALGAIIATPLSCLAVTDSMLDPTQPPAALLGSDGAAGEPVGPVLQSVLLAPGRKVAVISGQAVRVGEKFGDATLTRVTDQEVVLRKDDGTLQTLKMHPAVEKKVIVPPPASTSGTHKTKRPVHQAAPNTR